MLSVVYRLLDMGAPLNTANKHGHNPLIWACICGHTEVIKSLLINGADINHRTSEGRTALHYCCLYAKPKSAEVLFNFLFEKFQTFRLDHPRKKPDPTRWSRYSTILENFCNVEDVYGKKPIELVPSQDLLNEGLLGAASIDSLQSMMTYTVDSSFDQRLNAATASANVAEQGSILMPSQSRLLTDDQLRDDILPVPPPLQNASIVLASQNVPTVDADAESQESFGYVAEDYEENVSVLIDREASFHRVPDSRNREVMNMIGSSSRSVVTIDTDNFLAGLHGLNDSRTLLSVITGTEDIVSIEEVFRRTEVRHIHH
jgi:hypothetical protein